MDIVIAGAGGFAREVACWWGLSHVKGFIVSEKFLASTRLPPGYPPVIGTVEDARKMQQRWFAVAIADPQGREEVWQRMAADGIDRERFPNIFCDSSHVVKRSSLGNGCIIGPFANISADSVLGDGVIVNAYSGAGHDVEVGSFTTMSSHVDLCGGAKIGVRCFFGSRSGCMPKVKIGDDCVIGAGAFAYRNLPALGTLYENPPRYLAR